jgi:hypothetical protein
VPLNHFLGNLTLIVNFSWYDKTTRILLGTSVFWFGCSPGNGGDRAPGLQN